MAIPLVEPEEVQIRGGGRTKGEKYARYAQAVAHLIPWLTEQIEKSPDGKIRIRIKDIAKEMGSEFEKKGNTAMYWGLKFVLFHNGIVVNMGGSDKQENKLLLLRKGTDADKLPASLTTYREPPEEEMPEPGSEED